MGSLEPDGRSPIDWTGSLEGIAMFPQTTPMKRIKLKGLDNPSQNIRLLILCKALPTKMNPSPLSFYTHGSGVTRLMLIIRAFMSGPLLPYVAHLFEHKRAHIN